MIAVVTGGSGFIGRNLITRLLGDGHDVRCLVRANGGAAPAGASAWTLDLLDQAAVERCAALDGADVVFHLGGITRALRDDDFTRANVEPTRHLANALAARGDGARLIFVSSQAAAGPAQSIERPVREDDDPSPVEAYGRSKLAGEQVVKRVSGRVSTVIVRPAAVFGPFDRDFLTLFRMVRRGLVVYPGTRQHYLSLASVEDVVAAMMSASRSPIASGRTYFISTHESVAWNALVRLISSAIGRAGPPMAIDLPRPVVDLGAALGALWGRLTATVPLAAPNKAALARWPYWICSGSRAAHDLGVRAHGSLAEAVARTYLWYREQGWLRHGRRRAVEVT